MLSVIRNIAHILIPKHMLDGSSDSDQIFFRSCPRFVDSKEDAHPIRHIPEPGLDRFSQPKRSS